MMLFRIEKAQKVYDIWVNEQKIAEWETYSDVDFDLYYTTFLIFYQNLDLNLFKKGTKVPFLV